VTAAFVAVWRSTFEDTTFTSTVDYIGCGAQLGLMSKYSGMKKLLYNLIVSFFLIWDREAKDFGLNNSKHSQNLIYPSFHHECHSNLLMSSLLWSYLT
jgi:hypothetical protein